jgi:hypothetical protein
MSTQAEQIATATCIEELPPFWGEIASLAGTVTGVDAKTLGGYFKRPKSQIEQILSHPIVQEHVEYLKSEIALRLSGEVSTLTEARSLAIQGIKDHLAEYGDSMKVSELLNVLKTISDYHPDRRFVKVEKREEHRVIEHTINAHALEELRGRALENFNRKPVEALEVGSLSATISDIGVGSTIDDEGFVDELEGLDGEGIDAALAKSGGLF